MERQRRTDDTLTYLVVDASLAIGGSAATIATEDGFLFDYGGHILYPHQEFTDFIGILDGLVDGWHESQPVRGVWIDGRLVPYPVQSNIHRLPFKKFIASFAGLSSVSISRRYGSGDLLARNLEEYLLARFGRGLTHHVLGPINQKMWAHHPKEIATSWTTQRSGSQVQNVADTSVGQILRSMITRHDNLGWSESTKIRYPLRGGTGAIWTALAKQLPHDKMLSGERVVEVDGDAHWMRLDSGRVISYGNLISSLPLDEFLNLMTVNPALSVVGKLRMANAAFIGFGLRGRPPAFLDGVHSFHMPEPDVPCWRVSFPKSLSPGNVPPGPHWSILCEISHLQDRNYDLERAEQEIATQLRRRGIISSASMIVSKWRAQIRHGYPVPFLERDRVLQDAQTQLQARGIYSRGRFGGWKYEVSNQDHTFTQGVEAVRCIIQGDAEKVYRTDVS